MNWAALMSAIFKAVPYVVTGIEVLHKDAAGTSKKQMALDSLGLASGIASSVAPQYQEAIGAATQAAGCAIDAVVAGFNADKHPVFVAPQTQ
jgi:Na+/H+ antiporter NhaD/arsenite permease-like protein